MIDRSRTDYYLKNPNKLISDWRIDMNDECSDAWIDVEWWEYLLNISEWLQYTRFLLSVSDISKTNINNVTIIFINSDSSQSLASTPFFSFNRFHLSHLQMFKLIKLVVNHSPIWLEMVEWSFHLLAISLYSYPELEAHVGDGCVCFQFVYDIHQNDTMFLIGVINRNRVLIRV